MPDIEKDATYRQRAKKQRLTPELVAQYLKHMTNIDWPMRWPETSPRTFCGLSRSTADVETEIVEFDTLVDV